MTGPSEAGALHVSVSHTHENPIPRGNAPVPNLRIKSGSGKGVFAAHSCRPKLQDTFLKTHPFQKMIFNDLLLCLDWQMM